MLVPGLANQFLPDQYKPKNVAQNMMDYSYGAPVNMQTAKERGAAGVVGGLLDNVTFGATDFDKRGDSQRQKDTKEFLNKFIYGTQGDTARKTRDEYGGGDITSFNTGTQPGAKFGYTFNTSK